MSFRRIARDIRDSIGSLSRRSVEPRLSGHHRGKSRGAVHELQELHAVVQSGCWASLPPELLQDVIKRLETSESTWPSRKHVVACASVCRSWREMCKEIVQNPELCGKITFPVSLKQPGPRDGTIQCFIKRDKSNMTYHLFLCLSPALLMENGKFLLSAKRSRRTTCTEYVISMCADNISRSSDTFLGKVRFYTVETLREAYSIPVNPVPHMSEWWAHVPESVKAIVIKPPPTVNQKGRRRNKRILSQGEEKPPKRCGRCRQLGHYMQTCTGTEHVPVTSYDKA